MLSCLRIQNLAIIEALEVSFEPGLNVLTGETGAGKSILIDALGLVLGDKAHNDLVRTGATLAEVEALFDVGSREALEARLASAGLSDDDPDELEPEGRAGSGELLVRRVVSREGRSRAYVNGRLVTLAQLSKIAVGLADISSQHEHHTLVDARRHIEYLDEFGRLGETRERVALAYDALLEASRALSASRERLDGRSERADLLSFQIAEIDALEPVPGELDELRVERERLRHAERLLRMAGSAEEALYERDASISDELGGITAKLREAAQLDATLEPIVAALESAEVQIGEAARSLGAYTRGVSIDPERLGEVEERLHELGRIARKYAADADAKEQAILDHRARAKAELASLSQTEEEITALEAARDAARIRATKEARALSQARAAAAGELARRVTAELRTLGMSSASLTVDVEKSAPTGAPDELVIDDAHLRRSGVDRVEFSIAPNAGEEPRPLGRIASGGELSRTLLAIKRVLADVRQHASSEGARRESLYVFDEVDAGVGGAVAEAIGEKLRDVSRRDQVLCITHLGPIAVYADAHFRVQKETSEGRTRSDIVRLQERERVEEIARMVGGREVTKKTREVAAEMLRAAAH